MPKKTTNKRSNNTKLSNKIFGTHTRLAIIVAVFSLLGVIYLIGASANQIDITYKPTDIIAGSYSYKPTIANRNPDTNQVTYESYSNYELLLADGTIVCDDGNSVGDVKTGFIPQKRLDKLMTNLSNTGINSLADTPQPTSDVGNSDLLILNKGNNSKVVKTDRQVGKPLPADKLQKAIDNACRENANKPAKRDTIPTPTLPVRSKASASNSVPAKVANAITPKASAVPPTSVGYYNSDYTNKMVDWYNWERGIRGIPGLTRSNCLDTLARVHAETLMNAGYLYHQNIQVNINQCSLIGSWTTVGENVGLTGGDPASLTVLYMNSPPHASAILNRNFRCQGHGTWTRRSDNAHFHAAVFATWSNGRCN